MMASSNRMMALQPTMKRTQVQFTDEQLAALRKQAAEEGISLSALVRRAVDEMLSRRPSPTRVDRWQRALDAVGSFSSDGADVARQHDRYLADAYGAK